MTPLSKSVCISGLPVRCMRGGLGRFRSASIMLSSISQHASLQISSVAASRPALRVCSETALIFHGCESAAFTSSGTGMWVDKKIRVTGESAKHVPRPVHVLFSSRCYSVRTDASGLSSGSTISSMRTSSSTRAMAGHAVADPFIAQGDEQYENEYVAREAVLKYLQSQKVDTGELESVALPPSVAIMTERIVFLRKIGLTVKDINDYPLMVGCSVKKNLVPVLSFLERLNVEARFLPDLIRKYPMVLNSSVTMDLEPVVTFLLGIGIDRTNLGRVLTRFPDILGFKIEGTMSTSVAYLVSLGVNMREIGPMITEYPEILGMRVGNNIKPKVDFLLALGIPKEVLATVLEVKPFILGFDLEDKIKPVIKDLRDLGVREDYVPKVLIQYADVLGMDIKHRLDNKLGWLTKHAGVKRDNVGQILEKLPQILAINIALAQSRVTFMRHEGFSVEDLGIMVTKCPQILALSVDQVLKPNLDFFLKSMKRPLTELVTYPHYFTYNLDKRIRPRFIQIEQKGIQCSLSWFLNCSDSKFADRLLLDFVDRPDEEELDPLVSMGGRVKIKGEDIGNEGLDEESNVAAES